MPQPAVQVAASPSQQPAEEDHRLIARLVERIADLEVRVYELDDDDCCAKGDEWEWLDQTVLGKSLVNVWQLPGNVWQAIAPPSPRHGPSH